MSKNGNHGLLILGKPFGFEISFVSPVAKDRKKTGLCEDVKMVLSNSYGQIQEITYAPKVGSRISYNEVVDVHSRRLVEQS